MTTRDDAADREARIQEDRAEYLRVPLHQSWEHLQAVAIAEWLLAESEWKRTQCRDEYRLMRIEAAVFENAAAEFRDQLDAAQAVAEWLVAEARWQQGIANAASAKDMRLLAHSLQEKQTLQWLLAEARHERDTMRRKHSDAIQATAAWLLAESEWKRTTAEKLLIDAQHAYQQARDEIDQLEDELEDLP